MKRIILPGLAAGLFLCLVMAVLLTYLRDGPFRPPDDVSSQSTFLGEYVVTLWEGKVAIRQTGDTVPTRVYDLPVSMLSEYDRNILSKGVACDSLEEAQRLAEDYAG